MAASFQVVVRAVIRISPSTLYPLRQCQGTSARCRPSLGPFAPPNHSFCQAATLQDDAAASQETEALSRYKDRPWDYLESEEYIERYGANPVWAGYRRNHKGGIPPQKTRKTCIRGDKICGNPCPICRDSNVVIHHQNVKLLQQFVSAHTGMVYDPTQTGVCMKQHKKLTEAINTARDHGLLPFRIPYVDFAGEDYSNCHHAVGFTPPAPPLKSGDDWYKWYGEITPDQNEVAKVRKTYKAYLKPGL
ncbi:small ribosomal subunit protein mS40 [Hippocampus comes]|uniref:Small ribosomal subunit protein mS40 n=1 Tax=Hippocampus comes TaxID=109280 RepID=A0A3Q2YPT6_HIPCM|nr:PREDICTED: 28S ribosomal protein S18b, mitochondrial [Hippocampus comes]